MKNFDKIKLKACSTHSQQYAFANPWRAAEIVPSLWGWGTQTPSETEIADLWDWEGDHIATCPKMQTYPRGSKTEGTNYDTCQDNTCDPSAAFLG